MSQEFYETDPARDFVRGYSFEIRAASAPSRRRCGVQAGRMTWGADHHRVYADLFDRTAGMVVICEDLPEESNTADASMRASPTRTAFRRRRSPIA